MEGSNQLLDILSNKIKHLEIEDPTLNKEEKIKWDNLLEDKKKEFLNQLGGMSEDEKFEACKKIALDEANKKARLQRESAIESMRCAAVIKKKETLSRECAQQKNINQKLEELCRDFSNKNKNFENENNTLPAEEEAKRLEFLKKFNDSIAEMENEVSDEKIAAASELNEQLKCRVGLILEDDKSLDREYNEFMVENQKGTEGKQQNFQKMINDNINKALEEATQGKEEWQGRALSIQQMKAQMDELKKNTTQINESVSKSEEIIQKYEEEINKKINAIKQLEQELAPAREKKKQFDLELLTAFENNKQVTSEVDQLKAECSKLQKQRAKK